MYYWRPIKLFFKVLAILMLAITPSNAASINKTNTWIHEELVRTLRSYTMGLHQLPCNNIGRRCNPFNPNASGCTGTCRPGKSIRRCRLFQGIPYCIPVRII